MIFAAHHIVWSTMPPTMPISTPLNEWLSRALHDTGTSQAKLAELIDPMVEKKVDRSTINKMALGKRTISASEMLAISDALGYPLPSDSQAPSVEIAGAVGAGARVPVFEAYEKGTGPRVEVVSGIPTSGIVAVEVQGDSMAPVYAPGEILLYTRVAEEGVPDDAIGRICVIEDEDGHGWVKQLRVGSEPGLFHLVSINPGSETMHDRRVKWAARVRFNLPPEVVRKA